MRPKYQPKVTIRDRGEQSCRVEFSFPDGKGGLIEFFYAVHDNGRETSAQVSLYRFDDGIRVYLPAHYDVGAGVTRTPPGV